MSTEKGTSVNEDGRCPEHGFKVWFNGRWVGCPRCRYEARAFNPNGSHINRLQAEGADRG